MKVSQKWLTVIALLFIEAISVAMVAYAQDEATVGQDLAIIQGATSSTTTQIAILIPKFAVLRYELKDADGRIYLASHVRRAQRLYSKFAVDHLRFVHLPEGRELTFEVYGPLNKLLDSRTLKTFDTSKASVRIGLLSCMSDAPIFRNGPIWSKVFEENPDVLFFLGDNVYASIKDPVDPEHLWMRYVQTRSTLPAFKSKKLIPVYAIWDDHDFGQNDGDKSYLYVKEAQETFRDFFPQHRIRGVLEKGPGIAQVLTLFGRKFVFLDGRSFRDAPHGESMWGMVQEAWLKSQVLQVSTPLWVINGSQVFGKYGPSESLEKDFPKKFDEFVDLINQSAQPVSLISGDIHASEVIEIPRSLVMRGGVEITSSSMHSAHNPAGSLPKRNPRRLAGYDGDNFVVVTIEPKGLTDEMKIEGFTAKGQVFVVEH